MAEKQVEVLDRFDSLWSKIYNDTEKTDDKSKILFQFAIYTGRVDYLEEVVSKDSPIEDNKTLTDRILSGDQQSFATFLSQNKGNEEAKIQLLEAAAKNDPKVDLSFIFPCLEKDIKTEKGKAALDNFVDKHPSAKKTDLDNLTKVKGILGEDLISTNQELKGELDKIEQEIATVKENLGEDLSSTNQELEGEPGKIEGGIAPPAGSSSINPESNLQNLAKPSSNQNGAVATKSAYINDELKQKFAELSAIKESQSQTKTYLINQIHEELKKNSIAPREYDYTKDRISQEAKKYLGGNTKNFVEVYKDGNQELYIIGNSTDGFICDVPQGKGPNIVSMPMKDGNGNDVAGHYEVLEFDKEGKLISYSCTLRNAENGQLQGLQGNIQSKFDQTWLQSQIAVMQNNRALNQNMSGPSAQSNGYEVHELGNDPNQKTTVSLHAGANPSKSADIDEKKDKKIPSYFYAMKQPKELMAQIKEVASNRNSNQNGAAPPPTSEITSPQQGTPAATPPTSGMSSPQQPEPEVVVIATPDHDKLKANSPEVTKDQSGTDSAVVSVVASQENRELQSQQVGVGQGVPEVPTEKYAWLNQPFPENKVETSPKHPRPSNKAPNPPQNDIKAESARPQTVNKENLDVVNEAWSKIANKDAPKDVGFEEDTVNYDVHNDLDSFKNEYNKINNKQPEVKYDWLNESITTENKVATPPKHPRPTTPPPESPKVEGALFQVAKQRNGKTDLNVPKPKRTGSSIEYSLAPPEKEKARQAGIDLRDKGVTVVEDASLGSVSRPLTNRGLTEKNNTEGITI